MMEGALSAKAKAQVGAAISAQQFQHFIQSKSMRQLVEVLRSETHYAEVLEGVVASSIHRTTLERLLHKQRVNEQMRLLRYVDPKHHARYDLFYEQIEKNHILAILRGLRSGQTSVSLPLELYPYMKSDIVALESANTVLECVQAIQKSPYVDEVSMLLATDLNAETYKTLEVAIDRKFYERVLIQCEKLSTASRRQAKQLFFAALDDWNLMTIYRYKKYTTSPPDEVMRHLVLVGSNIGLQYWKLWCETKDLAAFLQALQSVYPNVWLQEGRALEQAVAARQHVRASKLLHQSQDPFVVFVASMVLKDLEGKNLTTIIEGVRYGVLATSLQDQLV